MNELYNPPIFAYAITPQTITTGTTVTPQINFANDSDFELVEIRASIFKAAAFSGTVLMTLSESSGKLYNNTGIDVLAFSANMVSNYSGYPIRLPGKCVIPANTSLNVQLTNNNGETVTVQVQFWGYKVSKQ